MTPQNLTLDTTVRTSGNCAGHSERGLVAVECGEASAATSTWTIVGPKCRNCAKTEMRCADLVLAGGCCHSCSHWVSFDRHGNPKVQPLVGPRKAPREHGTEKGYQQHRTDGTRACTDCRVAHSLIVNASCGFAWGELRCDRKVHGKTNHHLASA